jgi:hypothetical protein
VTDRTLRPGCGTRAGYYTHVHERSEVCDRCERAHDNYLARMKARRKAAGPVERFAPPPPDVLVVPGKWVHDAACATVDPELFYPAPSYSAAYAKRICLGTDERPGCPVRTECLQFALDVKDQWGVFGGLTAKERSQLKRGTAA